MEENGKTREASDKGTHHMRKAYRILAHSYTLYFILFLIGVYLDFTFEFRIFTNSTMVPVGVALFVLSSLLIFWAQKASRNIKTENVNKDTFCEGPYCYTRHPTHWGLFFLMLGFAIMANALFVVLSTLISFLLSRLVFLEKHEDLLAEKYGTPYLEYKKSVKL